MEIVPLERSGVSGINTMRFTLDGERYVCSDPRTDSALFHARGLRQRATGIVGWSLWVG